MHSHTPCPNITLRCTGTGTLTSHTSFTPGGLTTPTALAVSMLVIFFLAFLYEGCVNGRSRYDAYLQTVTYTDNLK